MSSTRLAEQTSAWFVGRDAELARLERLLEPAGPVAVFVWGVGGIGKSALLDRFAGVARDEGATVVIVDCGLVEPTARGVLEALGSGLGVSAALESIAARLAVIDASVMIVFDVYERFGLVDAWIRQGLVPGLPDNVRLVFAGRERPAPAWGYSSGPDAGVQAFELGPLESGAALALLEARGVPPDAAAQVMRFTRGHPLELSIAAAAVTEHPHVPFGDVAVPRVVDDITARYLMHLEPRTREFLDAASVVRRTTIPLLGAMVPDAVPADAFERLRRLPFSYAAPDGLVIHETMQAAIVAALHAADPVRHRALRRAAWRELRTELASALPQDLWRYTADMLWLVENPIIREAFFPSVGRQHYVEPAASDDTQAILAIARRHEPKTAIELVDRWWQRCPDAFRVARDEDGEIVGFYWMLEHRDIPRAWLEEYPVAAAWLEHLRRAPLTPNQTALVCFRWLDREAGELPCPAQAAMWLDIKRTYVELRPRLARLYTVVRDVATYLPIVAPLGFRPLTDEPVMIDEVAHFPVVLEFGPGSVDGWLSRLVAAELGVEHELFDPRSRSVHRPNGDVQLSRLESGLLEDLLEHEGAPVTRAELIERVWGNTYDGGSNVVDAVVRTLRRKIDGAALHVETVRGVGYRARRD